MMLFSQARPGWAPTGCTLLLLPAATHSLLLLLTSLLLPEHAQAKHIPSFAGPYISYGKMYSMCPPDVWDINARVGQIPTAKMYWRFSHFNPKRPRELQLITGNATLPFDVRDDAWVRVTLAIRSNNQWKDNAFVYNFPRRACWAARTYMPGLYEGVFNLDSNVKGECVIPKGFYSFEKKPFNWTFPSVPIMPYGHWRFRLEGGLPVSKTKLICFEVDCHTIPYV